ncbi:dynamin family protein [Cereibacter sphaeroides]|uniref:dynamin family protein n=1 Tax=Cereibacter sphaeroides TaxID=1063 RepID=UPI00313F1EF9
MNLPLELSEVVEETAAVRAARPRILVAGEFSSGKTSLVNALLGEDLLPASVTSTALPPIWIRHGEGAPDCLFLDGTVQRFASLAEMLAHLDEADLERISHCRLAHPSPLLRAFDLIDTPGGSDPGMPAASWERMVPEADMVVWCSPAVQAWRQSEKSAWAALPAALTAPSLLVLSQADRLVRDEDRGKVMRRVLREVEGLFAAVHMASFFAEADVGALRLALREAAAALPRRRVQEPADDPARTRIVPRRIRGRSAGPAPLLLVDPTDVSAREVAPPDGQAVSDRDWLSEAPAPASRYGAEEGHNGAEPWAPAPLDGAQPPMAADGPTQADGAPHGRLGDEGAVPTSLSLELTAGQEDRSVEAPSAEGPDLPEPEAALRDRDRPDAAPVAQSEPAEAPDDGAFLALLRETIGTPQPSAPPPSTSGAGEAEAGVLSGKAPAPDRSEPSLTSEAVAPKIADAPQPASDRSAPQGRAEPRTRAVAPAMMFGPARMLWERILPTLDPEDPEAILDGVDQLVAELDLTWARACLQAAPPSGRRRGGPA